jgi:transketolase
MRTAFIDTLSALAETDDRIWLLCADLGYSVLEGFAQKFPDRYVNVGVAEQNMAGIAAGLAMSGKIVFLYSIANFPTLRCLEQIRNDICYHNCNVNIVAIGGGLTYASLGYSHHGVEDIAILKSLPNMTVIAPGDPIETKLAVTAMVNHPSPCYLRLGKAGEPIVHQEIPDFVLGKAITLRKGSDIALISTGGMLDTTVKVADELARIGYHAQVISMPTVKPLDETAILEAIHNNSGRIVTLEEHGMGGLGSSVAEVIALSGLAVKFLPLRLDGKPSSLAGSQAALREQQGLSVAAIVTKCTKILPTAVVLN